MHSLKTIVNNGLIVLGLSFGLVVSVAASDSDSDSDYYEELEEIAKQGDAADQFGLGSIYSRNEVYTKSFYWFQQSANQGYASGQQSLGHAYLVGQGVRQDYKKALYWFQQSANQNSSGAQMMIGIMHSKGQGVRQNKILAKKWYGKSCDNGHQGGCELYRDLNELGY